MRLATGEEIFGASLFTEQDIYLFRQGNHFRLYDKLGCRPMIVHGEVGNYFAVWAPNAARVSVIGEFNGWNRRANPMCARDDGSGIWEAFVSGLTLGDNYKYHIVAKNGYRVDKGDPFGFRWEVPPGTASQVWPLDYTWNDERWMRDRKHRNALDVPVSVYEVHLGSWRRKGDQGEQYLTYRELAFSLVDYVREMGFTHVEFMPLMEHPFYGSWGYQVVGFFAATSRYGTPQDLMFLIDCLHQAGIGVIMDWVPSHFPSDEHGLVFFDGTHLFEHEDSRKGYHPEWSSSVFNYGRYEVCSFLISSALFWLDKYHVDCLRIDAVASMLYLDYARNNGDWLPNEHGGNEDIEAISVLKRLNEVAYEFYPDTQTVAEESTAWPMVSRPVDVGGLGFGMKWNMGWMHDTLEYFSKDPIYRKHHNDQLTFSIMYAFSENFLLPFSHDEVVYGKGSLLARMPGDQWQKFANLRLLYGYMYGHPGKKLLFMGGEFGQSNEWYHERSLDWHLLQYPVHQGVRRWVQDLNRFYASEPALYRFDFEERGFEWVDFHDANSGVISFLRFGDHPEETILVVCNLTPVIRDQYRLGIPATGQWQELLNSDWEPYGGSGVGNMYAIEADEIPCHGRPYSVSLTLPPLAALFIKRNGS